MSIRTNIWIIGLLTLSVGGAWAQDTPPDTTTQTPSTQTQEPLPAYGQQGTTPSMSENPPLSGLDLPSLEPNAAPLSYLQPGGTFSETADSNAGQTIGSAPAFSSVSRALGNVALRRLWGNYDLGLNYEGGVGYYSLTGQGWKLLQQMDVQQKINWKRGQLSLRDSFSYLPEGNFGTSYGSLGSVGIASLAGTGFGAFAGGAALGSLGLAPRILNVSVADVTESLTPKSTFTAAGGYAFTHFYGTDTTGQPFIGVSQTSAQAGYNRILTSHTQVALVYAYQAFDFSVTDLAFHTHVIQGMYGHRISGRMDLLIGAGPQITLLNYCPLDLFGVCLSGTTPETKIGAAGVFRLRYKFPKTSLDLSYQRYESTGSGFFAGAQTDVARLAADRPLSRVWNAFADIGYSHNSRLQPLSSAQLNTCVYPGQTNPPPNLPPCPGVDANTYQYGFLGGGLHRQVGHDFHFYASYQFNELAFDHSYCAGLTFCNRISNREIITFGLDWTPRPIRLD